MKCRKLRYPTRVDAEIALASTSMKSKRGLRHRRESRVYRCPDCKGYHLSSG